MRDAFIRRGFDAISCDLLPTESEGPHYQGDVRNILSNYWDLIIAHPTCTRLTNSGVRWLHERDLWGDLKEACEFFNLFKGKAKHVAIENPIPHKYARQWIGDYTQIIQPWQFGHGEQKAICLWLENLPPLVPTNIVGGREQRIWKMSPGKDRWKERSRFFTGIGEAMAEQWGNYILNES